MARNTDDEIIFEKYIEHLKETHEASTLAPEGEMMNTPDTDIGAEKPEVSAAASEDEKVIAHLREIKNTQGEEVAKAEIEKLKASNPELVARIAKVLLNQVNENAKKTHRKSLHESIVSFTQSELKKINNTKNGAKLVQEELQTMKKHNPSLYYAVKRLI